MRWTRYVTLTLLTGMMLTLSSASSTPSDLKPVPSTPKVAETSPLLGDTMELDRNCVDAILGSDFKVTIPLGENDEMDMKHARIVGTTGIKLNPDKVGCEPKIVRRKSS